MGKTDERRENRQQWYKPAADRRMAKTGRTKVRGSLCATMVLLLTMTVTVRYVQAIELGGFDVDMGTGSFEEMLLTGIMMQRRNQPEMRIMPAVMAVGAIQTVPGLPRKLQKQEMMCSRKQEERIFFHQDSMKRRLPVRLIMRRLQKKMRFQTGRRKMVL